MRPLALSGAAVLQLPAFSDSRGVFIKTFQESVLSAAGFNFHIQESYFSLSRKDVIRGMHFQLPPHHHSKVVFCPRGAILDVIIDLRRNSPTYGQYHAEELTEENHRAYFIPEGFAHGFKALTADAMTYYLVSSEYHSTSDTGIRWDSFRFDWGVTAPLVSARDQSFPTLADFESPF